MSQQVNTRFSGVAMSLHWLTVVLVLLAFLLGPGGSEAHIYSAARDNQRHLHETLGIAVFVLTLVRLLWRWRDSQPAPPSVAPWMVLAARLVQYMLYILLFLVPITAISGAWLEGHPLTLVGGIEIHSLFASAHAVGVKMAHLHTLLGDSIIWLAGLHALAALYHHVVHKDDVLVSMLPQSVSVWLKRKE